MPKKGYKPTEKHRDNLSLSHKGQKAWNKGIKIYLGKRVDMPSGENHYKWKKDRTQLAKRNERNDMAYKDWRNQVLKRDRYSCKINNKDCKGKVIAHHILSWSAFPELRYIINNGITLCHFHHPKNRNDEERRIPILKKLVES